MQDSLCSILEFGREDFTNGVRAEALRIPSEKTDSQEDRVGKERRLAPLPADTLSPIDGRHRGDIGTGTGMGRAAPREAVVGRMTGRRDHDGGEGVSGARVGRKPAAKILQPGRTASGRAVRRGLRSRLGGLWGRSPCEKLDGHPWIEGIAERAGEKDKETIVRVWRVLSRRRGILIPWRWEI
ncbi:hypothetical protein MRB53_009398 [Persea americana]|uniref:Uncharacterized protein n=1 Tax=Persea americana TaxID=3435 RepID=A0ACC2LNZ3_PERAE|nr:hypothetical protein MRB53_009398 [Persea americana]